MLLQFAVENVMSIADRQVLGCNVARETASSSPSMGSLPAAVCRSSRIGWIPRG